MSSAVLADLAQAGPSGLSAAATILTTTRAMTENVKVYRQQCSDMSGRCTSLMLSLRDSTAGVHRTKALELFDELTTIVNHIDRKVTEWAALSRLECFLQQSEIKDGIDWLNRDMDAMAINFGLELTYRQEEPKATQERDTAEIRDVLEKIVQSTEDMNALLNMQSSRSVEDVMESLQTELHQSNLQPSQKQAFQQGLWFLHKKTSKLPPSIDLTGQVVLTRNRTVGKGTFNDVFLGEWLDHEPVALRSPRTLASNVDAQKRFQREMAIWRDLDHPNVVPLYGVVYMGEDIYTVCPWMEFGTAIAYVQTYSTVDRMRILSEVAAGLEYLHMHGIIHGDLRGASILMSHDGSAVLADFGFTNFLKDCDQGISSSPNLNPRWSAPELLRETENSLTPNSDVWSFAMVCLELMTGEQPFGNISRDIAVLRDLDQGKLPERPGRQVTSHGLSDKLWALMKRCWHKKPELRPTMTVVKDSLAEMRGLGPSLSAPIKRRSRFFSRLPSGPRKIPTLTISSLQEHEADEHGLKSFASSPSSSSSRCSALSANPVDHDASLHLLQGTAISTKHDRNACPRASSSPLSPLSAHSVNPAHLRSTVSFDSGIQISAPSKEAPTGVAQTMLSFEDRSGTVSSGTLEGLVDRLINGSRKYPWSTCNNVVLTFYTDSKKDSDYREIFLIGSTEFTTRKDLFELLARKFDLEDPSNSDDFPEYKARVQNNILTIIHQWLISPYLCVDPQLFACMKKFCFTAKSAIIYSSIHTKIRDLIRLIDDRTLSQNPLSPTTSLSPGRRIPRTSEITPKDLAIALTLLEGDKYKTILPTDYLAHLTGQLRPNNVADAYLTNNKIVLWVKQSVLHYDAIDSRAQVLKFFVNTAAFCRQFRNFASFTAITIALHSAPIDRLRLTKRELSPHLRQVLDDLDDLLNPSANHKTYRAALREFPPEEPRDRCIPWLAVHLHDLYNSTLQKHPAVIDVDGTPLINFERYVRFTDRVKEILHYAPPDFERYRQQGQLAYLEHQLRKVHPTPTSDEELMRRSMTLEAGETRDYLARRRELKRLGFKTS